MEGRKQLLFISVGLCLISYYANSVDVNVKLHGPNPNENITKKLLELREQKQRMESWMANLRPSMRGHAELELQNINSWIRHYESIAKVSYKDYLKTVDEHNKKFEREQERLRRLLETADNTRLQTIEAFSSANRRDKEEIEKHKKKLQELTAERNRIAQQYSALTHSHYERRETMNREKMQLIKEREEMRQRLERARDLHSRALEAMAAATQEGYKPVSIPHQDEIEQLRNEKKANTITSIYNMELVYGLLSTQAKLEGLLEKLHSESKLSSESTNEDLEEELAKIEEDARRERDELSSHRQNILHNMKGKGLGGYGEGEIAALQRTNQQVTEKNEALQEVARRTAYLKAIAEVRSLVNECKNEVRDALMKRKRAAEAGRLPSKLEAEVKGVQNLKYSPDDLPNISSVDLISCTDPETIADVIYQKVSVYKDLHEFYRTRLSTEIVNGLAKVNKRLPIPFPGCNMTRIIEVRDSVGKWSNEVQYALRLTKKLNKGDNRSIIARFFVKFLSSIKNAFYTLIGRKEKETILEDDDDLTASIEQFDEQDSIDFDEHFNYIKSHFSVLDIDTEVDEDELKEFRYNLIAVKKAPEVLEEITLRILEKLNEQSGDKKKEDIEELKSALKVTEIEENRLQQVFKVFVTEIQSTLSRKVREYLEAREEYKQCRHGILSKLPMFSNISQLLNPVQ